MEEMHDDGGLGDVNPLVSVHVGVTIPGPQEYSSVRVDTTFGNISVLHDIEPQLERCVEVAKQVYAAAEQQLAEQAANASTLGIEGMGLTGRFEDFEKFTRTRFEQIIAEVKRLGELVKSIPGEKRVDDPPIKATSKITTRKEAK